MRKVSIQTAQNISIHQNLAGTFERILAYFLDILILYSFLFTVIYLFYKTKWISNMPAWSFMLVMGLPYFLYFPVIQYYNNGQSIGKKIMKIRIVKTDNTHPRLLDFIIRWIFRMIEISLIPGLALIFILFTKKKQRLGDIVARTSVVSEKNKLRLSASFLDEIDSNYTPQYKGVVHLKEKDIQIIKEILSQTPNQIKMAVFPELANKLEKIVNTSKPANMKDIHFINQVIKDYEYYSLHKKT